MHLCENEIVSGPKELITTTEISRMCRVPFATLYMAMLKHGFAPEGVQRHKEGGFTPLYDAARVPDFCVAAFGSYPAPLPERFRKPGHPGFEIW